MDIEQMSERQREERGIEMLQRICLWVMGLFVGGVFVVYTIFGGSNDS